MKNTTQQILDLIETENFSELFKEPLQNQSIQTKKKENASAFSFFV